MSLAICCRVRDGIKKRELTVEFLSDWGAYCAAAGAIELIWMANRDDVSRHRSKEAVVQRIDERERWCAHYIKRAMDAGLARKEADRAFEELLNHLRTAKRGELTDQERLFVREHRDWMDGFLVVVPGKPVEAAPLRPRFAQKVLSRSRIDALVKERTDDLPNLTLKFPDL